MTDKLMVVDDEEDLLDVLVKLFEYHGIETITSSNPIHALHLFEVERPQVVLSDFPLNKLYFQIN